MVLATSAGTSSEFDGTFPSRAPSSRRCRPSPRVSSWRSTIAGSAVVPLGMSRRLAPCLQREWRSRRSFPWPKCGLAAFLARDSHCSYVSFRDLGCPAVGSYSHCAPHSHHDSFSPLLHSVQTAAYCERLAAKYSKDELPTSCRDYFQHQASPTSVDPFAGMRPGSAASARAHRSKGQEHHAQVQRRLTSSGRRFSKLNA
jgi:hypothetical protein